MSTKSLLGFVSTAAGPLVESRRGPTCRRRGGRVVRSPVAPTALLVPASRVAGAAVFGAGFLAWSLKFGKDRLTPAGSVSAAVACFVLWLSMGFWGASVALIFFFVGSAATKVGKEIKEREGTAQERGGARGPANVWGAIGVGCFCATVALLSPLLSVDGRMQLIIGLLAQVAYVGSVAAKFFDTLSSEIGKAYGSTTVLATTFRRVPRGTEGAISVEGTLAGLAGAAFITVYAWFVSLIPYLDIPVIIGAAFLANYIEGIVGSTIQEKVGLSNEAVNVINTFCGAAFSVLIRLALTYFNVFY